MSSGNPVSPVRMPVGALPPRRAGRVAGRPARSRHPPVRRARKPHGADRRQRRQHGRDLRQADRTEVRHRQAGHWHRQIRPGGHVDDHHRRRSGRDGAEAVAGRAADPSGASGVDLGGPGAGTPVDDDGIGTFRDELHLVGVLRRPVDRQRLACCDQRPVRDHGLEHRRVDGLTETAAQVAVPLQGVRSLTRRSLDRRPAGGRSLRRRGSARRTGRSASSPGDRASGSAG